MPEIFTNRPRVRASIISFLRNLLPKRIVSAINVLLKPCCTLDLVSFNTICNVDTVGDVDVILTFTDLPNFANYTTLYSTIDGTFTGGVISGNTVTFTGLTLTPGDAAFVVTVSIVIVGDPNTSPNSTIAVVESTTLGTHTIPDCS